MKNFKLSIIIPFYHGETLVGNLFHSLSESYIKVSSKFEIEIIIIIDSVSSSIENIEDILSSELNASEFKNRIRIRKNQNNIGVSQSRNFGLSISQGEYVTFIDQDDFVSADYFSVISEKLNYGYDLYVLNGFIVQLGSMKKVPLFYFRPDINLKH